MKKLIAGRCMEKNELNGWKDRHLLVYTCSKFTKVNDWLPCTANAKYNYTALDFEDWMRLVYDK